VWCVAVYRETYRGSKATRSYSAPTMLFSQTS
jgi:hypothetical protein